MDITKLLEGATHLDLWLLCGQSNMKGRGVMPEEPKKEPLLKNLKAMNEIQLALPKFVPHTACVDARDLKAHIGDSVHFDTAAQNEIGRRFAQKWIEMGLARIRP
ncbi:MAG: hypothetical protein IPK32_08380 [Verrucomicrobiaceae bacterium]|nr:hypothetical protein [Verrucomicrobiaceae bacterium]